MFYAKEIYFCRLLRVDHCEMFVSFECDILIDHKVWK